MTKGRIKWFNDSKGFGFIESAEGDVFVHITTLKKCNIHKVVEGEEVEFEANRRDKGLQATKVTKTNPDQTAQ